MEQSDMTPWTEKLNKLSLRDFSQLYATGSVPVITNTAGYYRAAFVGPAWLRATAGPAIAIGGLANWWGKHIRQDGSATNLIWQGEKLVPRLTMQLIDTTSALDGKHTLALIYGPENPFPWPYVVDELRRLEPGTFLGMTHSNAGPWRRIAFPFLLQVQDKVDGL
jgi:hypothetical protein